LNGVARSVLFVPAYPGGKLTMRRIEVRARANGWVVRVEEEDGGAFYYACASEKQARYFAAVYRLQRTCLKREQKISSAASEVSSPGPRGRAQPPGRAGGYVPA
jgi:hypothetical protein